MSVKLVVERIEESTGDVVGTREADAWNIHNDPDGGITVNFPPTPDDDEDEYEQVNITRTQLARIGFFENRTSKYTSREVYCAHEEGLRRLEDALRVIAAHVARD